VPAPLVLMYHGFGQRSSSQDPQNLFVPAATFEAQLRSLLQRGRKPLDEAAFLEGIRRGGRWPAGSFLVTIDDGYTSTLDVAAPVLARLRIPAVMYALTGLLGATSRWMPEMPDEALLDRDGLRELPNWGVSVGLHGLDHLSLAGQSADELRRQTVEARQQLTEVTGQVPASFAYPFGHQDAAARQAVAEAGFEAAFAIYSADGPLAFPRVDVNALDTPRTFRLKTSRVFPRIKAVADRAPAVRRFAHAALGKTAR
jgi:peptidoglycan/xylan/chitin deacetylase (PgdA/CDA1 family)